MASNNYNRGLHRVSILVMVATFLLIFIGGLVTSHGAGLAVPDWPSSFGYPMMSFPPRYWVGGIFYEHTHRLMGMLVGLLAIVLMGWALWTESRRWVRWLSVFILLTVIVQGVLGGLRVIDLNLDLAIIHACLAQATFGLTALMVVVTSQWWAEAPDLSRSAYAPNGRWLVAVAFFAVTAIYLQIVSGAIMRHHNAGLAIPDFPLNYGHLLPPLNDAQLERANELRLVDPRLPTVTLQQILYNYAHRLGAAIAAAAIIALAIGILRSRFPHPRLRRMAWIMMVVLIVQLTLGAMIVWMRKPPDITTSHVAIGAALLAITCVMAARVSRLYAPLFRSGQQPSTPFGAIDAAQ